MIVAARVLVLVLVAGCDAMAPRPLDAARADAGGRDAGDRPDASETDASVPDGGAFDGGFEPSPVNVGWIGGACAGAGDCFDVADPICVTDGYPNGMCTQECDGICPDRGEGDAVTLCVDGIPHGFDGGICASRCEPALLPPEGCPDGYRCVEHNRYGDPSAVFAVCVPDRPSSCPEGEDALVPLDYPDRGAVWIPAEAACEPSLDVLVLLHGINPASNPTPSLGGGRRVELLVRQLIDAELIHPLVLAEPVHFEPGSSTLYGSEFEPAEHLERVRAILAPRGITFRTLSYAGHSGAGCSSENGMYEVLDRFDDLVGPFAPSMRLWGLMDICYGGTYPWQRPQAALAGRGVVVANMFTTGGSVANVDAFEAGLLGDLLPLDCDAALYSSCVRSPSEPWCSYRTRTSAGTSHSNNPYFFLREILPQAFATDPSVAPCR